jgi:hypothetical protein
MGVISGILWPLSYIQTKKYIGFYKTQNQKNGYYSQSSTGRPIYFLVEIRRTRINQGQFVCVPKFQLKPLGLRSNNAINHMTICRSCSISTVLCIIK